MTNLVALILGIVILVSIGADLLANEGAAVIFLIRKFLDLIEWVAFWR